MSKEEAIKYVISNKSWWWRKKLLRNINNGVGTSMIDDAVKQASHLVCQHLNRQLLYVSYVHKPLHRTLQPVVGSSVKGSHALVYALPMDQTSYSI